jgi:hypothetical protein
MSGIQRVIGGWTCYANWSFLRNRAFEIRIPFNDLNTFLKLEKVVVHPELNEIQIFGTFTPNKISASDITTHGPSCWKSPRRYACDGGTDGTP